jgi:hypothetical protein
MKRARRSSSIWVCRSGTKTSPGGFRGKSFNDYQVATKAKIQGAGAQPLQGLWKAEGFLSQIPDVQDLPSQVRICRADTWCHQIQLVIIL